MRARLAFSLLGLLMTLWSAAVRDAVADNGQQGQLLEEASKLATDAISRLYIGACTSISNCDLRTGCLAPIAARTVTDNALSDDKSKFRLFQACRILVFLRLDPAGSDPYAFNFGASAGSDVQFAANIIALNGDIFWAPASKSIAPITQFGDEARSVFGPIPTIDCTSAALTTRTEVNGNSVDIKPNPNKQGSPLEFEHRDPSGRVVMWTTTLPECDKPTLAGGWKDTYCGLNNRFNVVNRGAVEWAAFCRKVNGAEVTANPYWQASNPLFTLLGMIGFNQSTGETVFFDGREHDYTFDWSQPFPAPGGNSYADAVGRAAAEATYDPEFGVECSFCHDNKNSHIVNPHIGLARVGYRDDTIRNAFGIDDGYLPQFTQQQDAPFRVIGSAYTATYKTDLIAALSVRDPTGKCRGCHTFTTQEIGQRFAADAVAQQPYAVNSNDDLQFEIKKFGEMDAHRTPWARATGLGKIHPWMVPTDGNDLSGTPAQMTGSDWQKLSNCLWGQGGSECHYERLFTSCPAPESSRSNVTQIADPYGPTGLTIRVINAPPVHGGSSKAVRLSWKYLNRLGAVPERDDVRFNIAIKEIDSPNGNPKPSQGDFPTMSDVQGKNWTPISGDIGRVGAEWLLRNASYAGHQKWTDPNPSLSPRDYQIDIPAACGKRYLIRIAPLRFCFDLTDQAFSGVDHVEYVDVDCS